MPQGEGEVRDIPFLRNDLKDQPTTTGRSVDQVDAPGKADSEWTEDMTPETLKEPGSGPEPNHAC